MKFKEMSKPKFGMNLRKRKLDDSKSNFQNSNNSLSTSSKHNIAMQSNVQSPAPVKKIYETKDSYKEYRKFQSTIGKSAKIGDRYQAITPAPEMPAQYIELQKISERNIWSPSILSNNASTL